MAQNPIQWFPGHMAKTKRVIKECLSQVDIVLELLDARIPASSKNPETQNLIGDKPKLTVITKATLANPELSLKWAKHYESHGERTVIIDSSYGIGIDDLSYAVRDVLSEKLARYKNKGMENRALKAMIVGIPNVGKSSLINRLAGAKKAKVENRPGVTLAKQWIPTEIGIHLLDMPGVLWPKFEDQTVGENLAISGAIKDDVLDIEAIAAALCGRLRDMYPELLMQRYKLDSIPTRDDVNDYELLTMIGRKRGHLISGGEIDTERTANMLIDEFRAAKIGRISLEFPQ